MILTSASELGAIIRARRKSVEVSQGDLASAAYIDQANLSRIERGTTSATLETYLRLCKALGLNISVEPRR